MMLRITVVALALSVACTALAGQKTFVVDDADVLVLAKGLHALPYGEVAPLIDKLQKQINEQVQAEAEAKSAADKNTAKKAAQDDQEQKIENQSP